MVTVGWRPSDAAIRRLLIDGVWRDVVGWMAQDYHLMMLSGGVAVEVDLDAAFISWVRRNLGRNIVSHQTIGLWVWGTQLRLFIRNSGYAGVAGKADLYRAAVSGRGEANMLMDHDAGFRQFIMDWT